MFTSKLDGNKKKNHLNSFACGVNSDHFPLEEIIQKAANLIPIVKPIKQFSATNPLCDLESIPFEDAVRLRYAYQTEMLDKDVIELNREMIKWCQAYYDRGQANFSFPNKEKGFYQAWFSLIEYDPRIKRFSQILVRYRTLPRSPLEALKFCLNKFEIPKENWEENIRVLLSHLPGWAGFAKGRDDGDNKNSTELINFTAVYLAIAYVFFPNVSSFFNKFIHSPPTKQKVCLQRLHEVEDKTLHMLLSQLRKMEGLRKKKKELLGQFLFCIDIRSELIRKQLEKTGKYETYGMSGSFGVPVIGKRLSNEEITNFLQNGNLARGVYYKLKEHLLHLSAVVETMGLWAGICMVFQKLFPTQFFLSKRAFLKEIVLSCESNFSAKSGFQNDIAFAAQVEYAEQALRLIGLTKDFSAVVVITGHRGQTVNNPYSSAFHCGACGGNHGGNNAKILASILNDPEVRQALKDRGVVIGSDVLFVAAEHNTTTDCIKIFPPNGSSRKQSQIINEMEEDFKKVREVSTLTRCKKRGSHLQGKQAVKETLVKSSNWAETRPEWALAGNKAMIIGPRFYTEQCDFHGQVFLHSYDPSQDPSGKFLEKILMGPLIVAERINMLYLFSSFDNRIFGSGSKITQNIVGKIGVMQGNGSDLMVGLPLQSINSSDQVKFHDPARLVVMIYAKKSILESIIEQNETLKNLFYNKWVHIVVIDPESNDYERLIAKRIWEKIG